MIPDRGNGWPMACYRLDRPFPPIREQRVISVRAITPGYLETYRIPLLKGRDFAESDTANGPKVILINQAFAELFFPGEDPVGYQIHCAGPKEIVGVIADVKNSGLASETKPEVFVTYAQWDWPSCYLTLRTHGDLKALAPALSRDVRAINPHQPLANLRRVADYLNQSTARPRFHSILIGFFAVTAMLLAAVGIYGVMAVSVAQRTQEMGVRMALGARRSQLLLLVLGRGMALTVFGLFLGIFFSFGLTRVLSNQLYGVTAGDPFTFAFGTILLAAVAAIACLIPARRAASVDPVVAIRCE
jgi:putative ABC transport system permease protein